MLCCVEETDERCSEKLKGNSVDQTMEKFVRADGLLFWYSYFYEICFKGKNIFYLRKKQSSKYTISIVNVSMQSFMERTSVTRNIYLLVTFLLI